MKTMIKPALFGSMAAIGLMLIICIGRTCQTFTWKQLAMIAGVALISVSMNWLIKNIGELVGETE